MHTFKTTVLLTFIQIFAWTTAHAQAPVLDPNCYFPDDSDPKQIDSIYGSRDGQGMGAWLQKLPDLWSDDPLEYLRVDRLTPGDPLPNAVTKVTPFNLRQMQRRKFTNFAVPAIAQFAHFRSKDVLDMYISVDYTFTIYWADDDGMYDSSRSSKLTLIRPGVDPNTYYTPLYTPPYIAVFPGDEVASIITSVKVVHFEGLKDSVFFIRFNFEGEILPDTRPQPKEVVYFDTLTPLNGRDRFYFQQGNWRNERQTDLISYDPWGNVMYYRNDKSFSFQEFLRSIHEDTLFTRWQNPRSSSQTNLFPLMVLTMSCVPRQPGDKGQDMVFLSMLDSNDDDDRYLIVFKGGEELGKRRFFIDSAEMIIRSPGSHPDFPFTGMGYDVSNAGDLTGTGNNVLLWQGSGSLRNYFFFYVMGRAMDSLADIFFAMEPYAYARAEPLWANSDQYQDLLMAHPVFYTWEDLDRGKTGVGTIRLLYGSPKIPLRLNPKYSVKASGNEKVHIKAYPNPFIDKFTVNAPFAIGKDLRIEVYDVTGRLAHSQHIAAVAREELTVILQTELPTGSYVIRLTQEGFSAHVLLNKE